MVLVERTMSLVVLVVLGLMVNQLPEASAKGHRWSQERLACVWKHNTNEFFTSNIEDCKVACEAETRFVCRSIDYVPGRRCVLSTANSTSGSYQQPCSSPWEKTIFTEIITGCPEGFFKLGDSDQCFILYHDHRRTWFAAKSKCEANQLTLAEPQDPVAMTSYLTTTYGLVYWTWLGVRGNGNTMVWQRDGVSLSNTSPYWRPGRPEGRVSARHCTVLQTAPDGLKHYPNNPYNSIWCADNKQWTLCEL